MSRIGKLPVTILNGVTITVGEDNTVTVKGPKGQLSEHISKEMLIEQENGVLHVKRPSDEKRHRALHGLSRTLINNMVVGVTKGFSKNLDIVGVGYRAQKQGNKLVLNVGYSHPVEFTEPAGITFEVPAPNKIVVNGMRQTARRPDCRQHHRAVREPEPYKGKGIKYDTEVVLPQGRQDGKK
jgi:large subunit ribosomal protein L6